MTTRYQITTPQGPPVEGPRPQDAQDAELPRHGYVDRIEVDDGGSVTYATPGAWICHQMPWVEAAELLASQGRTVREVPYGQPWPDLLVVDPPECTHTFEDVRGRP